MWGGPASGFGSSNVMSLLWSERHYFCRKLTSDLSLLTHWQVHASLNCCQNWLLELTVAPYPRELSAGQRGSDAQIRLAEEIGSGGGGSLWQPTTAWRRGGAQPSPLASVCHDSVEPVLLQCSFWNEADLGLQLDPHFCQLLSLSYPASSLLTGGP